tara:strand:+ start:666 stop:1247 length:582 start_codon:yes stop_codon:yes gene_type:complete
MAGEIQLNGTSFASESSGTITVNNGTIGGSVVFPSGHIIQTVSDVFVASSATTVSTTANDYLGSDLQCTITPTATGNKLFIQAFVCGVYNNAVSGRGLHSGFAYDANFSSGNGTTIGSRAVISNHEGHTGENDTIITNAYYSIVVTVGTQAPSAGSASIIRPILQATGGDVQIGFVTGAGLGVYSMIVMEIQA